MKRQKGIVSSCSRGWDCCSHYTSRPPQQKWSTEDPEGPGALWWQHEGCDKEGAEWQCWPWILGIRTQRSCSGKHHKGWFSQLKKPVVLRLSLQKFSTVLQGFEIPFVHSTPYACTSFLSWWLGFLLDQ